MTKLELDETKRRKKWGRYGIHKYVYEKDQEEVMKDTLYRYVDHYFPNSKIEYFT